MDNVIHTSLKLAAFNSNDTGMAGEGEGVEPRGLSKQLQETPADMALLSDTYTESAGWPFIS
jgi:hypothetical protein